MSHLFYIAYSKESAVPSESAFAGRSGLNWGCDTQKLNWRWKKKEEEDANCKYVKTRGKSDTAITCWLFKFLFSINKRKGFKCYYVHAGGGGGDDGDGDDDDGRRWSIPHLHHLHQELPCLFPVDLSKGERQRQERVRTFSSKTRLRCDRSNVREKKCTIQTPCYFKRKQTKTNKD